MTEIHSEILQAGVASGSVLVLDEPLSFWGGINPVDGIILESRHPQKGQSIAGKVILLTSSKGSAGTPGGLAENIRVGFGPSAIILTKSDVNIAVGAIVAADLYDIVVPVLKISTDDFGKFRSGQAVSVSLDGVVHLSPK